MASATIQTVTGPISPEDLGPTLMHEHVLIGYPGWESHTTRSSPDRGEMLRVCVDRIEELKAAGFRSMVDPCPNDLGRDVDFIAEVASRARFNIICATGLYKESEGGAAYWHMRANFGSQVGAMVELFERELREGVGRTGIRPGIIKLATGPGQMSTYERSIFEAGARAAVATGAPITTHTDKGTVGDVQQKLLVDGGVAAQRIVIGHSCGTSDAAYHLGIARGGSYLGFDRFGLDALHPDAERTQALLRLLQAGTGDRVVVSHDSVWCWRGEPFGSVEAQRRFAESHTPLHFTRKIAPKLREGGASEAQIRALTLDNPRRFFAGEKLPGVGLKRSVIVLRACALGDLVVTGPLLERLPAPFLVAHAEHVALARAAGWIDAGIDADLAGLHALYADEPDPAQVAPVLRARLACGEPILVLGRPGVLHAALVRGLAAAGAREVSAHDPLPPPGVHAADHLAAAAGPCTSTAVPRMDLPEALRALGREHLRALGLGPDGPVIALHPGAGAADKRWPVPSWVAAWQELGALGQPVIICGPADEQPAKQLAARLGAPLLRDLPLVDLAGALAGCRALLGHDSGISHLSAALGLPTLALFGPTDPAQWAPRGPASQWLRAETGCLSALDPAAVIASARALLCG